MVFASALVFLFIVLMVGCAMAKTPARPAYVAADHGRSRGLSRYGGVSNPDL